MRLSLAALLHICGVLVSPALSQNSTALAERMKASVAIAVA
jgi:hypothetical protein